MCFSQKGRVFCRNVIYGDLLTTGKTSKCNLISVYNHQMQVTYSGLHLSVATLPVLQHYDWLKKTAPPFPSQL